MLSFISRPKEWRDPRVLIKGCVKNLFLLLEMDVCLGG